MIDPEFKAKWVAALRSGGYQQAKHALADVQIREDGTINISYCCLGVACTLRDDVEWTGDHREDDKTFQAIMTHYGQVPWTWHPVATANKGEDWNESILPIRIREKIGLTETEQGHLTGLNDSGKSFSEIADWIEENL